jgi:hypothetical protein
MSNFNYVLNVATAMYDGEGDGLGLEGLDPNAGAGAGTDPNAGAGAGAGTGAGTGAGKAGVKIFTQDEVNKFLADERRKTTQKYTQLEGAYKEALANQNLTQEQRVQLEEKLEDLQKTFRTKEEQLKHEQKAFEERYTKELTGWKDSAQAWEARFKNTMLEQKLQDAAVKHDAHNPNVLTTLLKTMSKVVEKTDDQGKGTGEWQTIVDLTDVDAKTGEMIVTRRTPEDAVKRMKELPEYGGLFSSNVVSGIGAGTAPGGNRTGAVDPGKLTTEQYMEMRRKDPSKLGLPSRR